MGAGGGVRGLELKGWGGGGGVARFEFVTILFILENLRYVYFCMYLLSKPSIRQRRPSSHNFIDHNFAGKLSSKAKSDNQSLAAWASDMIEDFYKSQTASKNLIIEVAGVLDKLSLK